MFEQENEKTIASHASYQTETGRSKDEFGQLTFAQQAEGETLTFDPRGDVFLAF